MVAVDSLIGRLPPLLRYGLAALLLCGRQIYRRVYGGRAFIGVWLLLLLLVLIVLGRGAGIIVQYSSWVGEAEEISPHLTERRQCKHALCSHILEEKVDSSRLRNQSARPAQKGGKVCTPCKGHGVAADRA